jgi:hypothetical protein
MKFRRRKPKDLGQHDLPQLDWKNPDKALSAIFDYAIAYAREAEGWYMNMRGPKRVGGRTLRVVAIALVGAAALIPILGEIYGDGGKPAIPPAWASVALLVAATLIGFDRFFGFSTGWARFLTAGLEIGRLRHDFEFEWQELAVSPAAEGPLNRLQLAHDFVEAVDKVVAQETGAWQSEFQAALDAATNELNQQRSKSG